MATQTQLSKIKKGEYFRFAGKKKVYKFEGGGKVKGYQYTSEQDINDTYTTKADKKIEINFTY